MDATVEVGPSLIKKLGASDNKTRNQALQALIKTWLPSQSQISDDDFKKLWKGLFYCVWHSDKISNQSYLIDSLSSLLPVLQLPLSIQYFTVFLSTMRREWTGIDRLRLDKFYLLIRRFMHFAFVLLKKNNWDLELVNVVMRVLKERVFLADDRVLGNGVNYHVVAVFLDEIKGFYPLRKEVCEVLFGGFVEVMAGVSDKILVGKIKSCVFDELVRAGRQLLEVKKKEKSGICVELEEDVVNVGSVGLALGFASRFYELGSTENCVQGNRKVLLGLHEEFLKLEKDLAQSGIEISVPEVVNGDCDEDEVPTLVPIAGSGSEEENGVDIGAAGGDGNVRLKKCKKSDGSGKKAKKNKNEKSSDGSKKKKKKKKNDVENENVDLSNGEETSGSSSSNQNSVTFTDSVISNLQMQFEKVAAEVGLDQETATPITKKRKRTKETSKKQSKNNSESNGQVESEKDVDAAKSGEKSAKRVRFSMKSNLVWRPHSPLPPQSLRIPPSVTPRGSALKKGIPAGPIREMPGKKAKKPKQRAKSLKKKGMNGISPATKRLKKLKSVSL